MERVTVEIGVHRDRGDAELAARAHDAHGDLAAVRDEDLRKQTPPPDGLGGTPYPTGDGRSPGYPGRLSRTRPSAGRCVGSPPSTRRTSGCSTRPGRARPPGSWPSPITSARDAGAAGACGRHHRGRPSSSRCSCDPQVAPGSIAHRHDGGRRSRSPTRSTRCAASTRALKWPNDLVVGDRKIAGLLAEAELAGDDVRALVVGVGCNLAQSTLPRRSRRDRDIVHDRGRPRPRARRRCSTTSSTGSTRGSTTPPRRSSTTTDRASRPWGRTSASSSIRESSSAAPATSTTAVASSSRRHRALRSWSRSATSCTFALPDARSASSRRAAGRSVARRLRGRDRGRRGRRRRRRAVGSSGPGRRAARSSSTWEIGWISRVLDVRKASSARCERRRRER